VACHKVLKVNSAAQDQKNINILIKSPRT
jgi:hypothetical protein